MDELRLKSVCRNILDTLQTDPRQYRLFGIFWWPVKAILRRYYTTDNLYMLGEYEDANVAEMVPAGSLDETLSRALHEYGYNAQFNMLRAEVRNEEGEPVTIYDDDAGI